LPRATACGERQRVTRQFASIAQMAQEQREVRIWGGIHFPQFAGRRR
jgi:hypothetical protein